MNKLEREIRDAVKAMPVEFVSMVKDRGHWKLTVRIAGREKTFSVSGTPTNYDYTVKNVCQDINRYIKGIYR